MGRRWLCRALQWIGGGVVCLLAIPAAILLLMISLLWSFIDSLTTRLEIRRRKSPASFLLAICPMYRYTVAILRKK